ncbi:hypothetical protein DPEC_G00159300 [Dallia pectoralis]|uniref:Uncharacterized protein n=1 Tax=Dallia pectoralis TaxID=75939 RepID=A0ACC2GG01_DALPE|nr:hypothetical protein DPEC_G00159300 [Dallia pectoralis]
MPPAAAPSGSKPHPTQSSWSRAYRRPASNTVPASDLDRTPDKASASVGASAPSSSQASSSSPVFDKASAPPPHSILTQPVSNGRLPGHGRSNGHGMGNSSRKEEGQEEDKDEDEEKAKVMEEERRKRKKKKEEEAADQELPLGVEELLASGDPVLDLSYKKFRRLPGVICGLNHLEKLYVCGNSLRTVPENIVKLKGLRILALDFNKIEDVPLAICELRNLTRLYLGSNRLVSFPPELRNLQNLRCLWMESNYFTRFPRQLYDLPQLRSLQMGDNRLRSLPPDLCRMEALRGLWLYGNRFTEFPRVLLRMVDLEILDLDKNKITVFPNLRRLPALRLFSYDGNPVEGPPGVGEEVLLVGEGAQEELDDRAYRKAKKEQEAREREEAALAGEGPVIQGILKTARENSASYAGHKHNEVVSMTEEERRNKEMEEELERALDEYGAGLEYDLEGIEYEKEELIQEGDGFEEYEGQELEYERRDMDYEEEEALEETGREGRRH